jgi:hypothetical protein
MPQYRFQQYQQFRQFQSPCPGGVCPLPQTGRRLD